MPRLPVGDTPPRGLRASESSSSPASNRVGLAARRLRGWVREALPRPAFHFVRPAPRLPSEPPDCSSGLVAWAQAELQELGRAEVAGRGHR